MANFLLVAFLVASLGVHCQAQQYRCSYDRQRQCQESLNEGIQKRALDITSSDLGRHCRNIRDSLNCLLWQTAACLRQDERQRNGDLLRRASQYIRDTCNVQGDWRNSQCYQSEHMRWCQGMVPFSAGSSSSDNCWKYNSFYTCVTDALRRRCSQDDALYLGTFLVDNARESSWMCGIGDNIGGTYGSGSAGSSSYDRDRDRNWDRDRDRDRDRNWDRDRDRDRNWDRDRDRDRNWDRDRDRDRRPYSTDSPYHKDGELCCRNERCSTSRMEECRDAVSKLMETNLQIFDNTRPCRDARDNFNCLLWHTSKCGNRNDRERNKDLLQRAHRYISRSCDAYGRYSDKSCYTDSEMKQCESNLPDNRSPNYEGCRGYLAMRDCATQKALYRCQTDDELYLGAYLADKGVDMAWLCSSDYSDTYNPDRNFPDSFRTPSWQSDIYPTLSADDAYCAAQSQPDTSKCNDKKKTDKMQIPIDADPDRKQQMSCCISREYNRCVADSVRKNCGNDNDEVLMAMLGNSYNIETSCREYPESNCNGAAKHTIGGVLLIVTVTLFAMLSA